MYSYNGALHIHSTYSDGTGSISYISSAAKKANLDWIIITDHNNIKGLENKKNGWNEKLAVIVGQEISPKKGNHYLAFGLDEAVSCEQTPQEYINEVRNKGGVGFIAHPDESDKRKNNYPPLIWEDWNTENFDGLEIWNHLSDWVDSYEPKNAVKQYFFRNNYVKGPTEKVLNWWDSLNKNNETVVPAVGGVDAHALNMKFKKFSIKIFPYKSTFKTVRNRIYLEKELSSDFKEAENQILTALKNGNNIIYNAHWGDFDGFYAKSVDKKIYPGQTATLEKNMTLTGKVEKSAVFIVIKDGVCIHASMGKKLHLSITEPGSYRIEVRHKGKPWIFTNPMIIKS